MGEKKEKVSRTWWVNLGVKALHLKERSIQECLNCKKPECNGCTVWECDREKREGIVWT